jgi:hypothetical protein
MFSELCSGAEERHVLLQCSVIRPMMRGYRSWRWDGLATPRQILWA